MRRTAFVQVLVLVALAGCASGPPTTYARGAPGPTAPTFRPSQDAPHTVGQPGHLRPAQLPRSPHKRVLPPSTEPGIYAGDQPRAAKRESADARPMLLGGFEMPSYRNSSTPAVRNCVHLVEEKLKGLRGFADREKRDRLCHLLQAQAECLVTQGKYHQSLLKGGKESARALTEDYYNTLQHTKQKRDSLCNGVKLDGEILAALEVEPPRGKSRFRMIELTEEDLREIEGEYDE